MNASEPLVDHFARREIAVVKEALRGTNEKLDDVRDEVKESGLRLQWTIVGAVVLDILARVLGGH